MKTQLFTYLLHLADNALILAQRNSEWCGHGPALEQDIAITNISLDLLGQSRNFYQAASAIYNNFEQEEKDPVAFLIPSAWKEFNRELNEDDLAFLREEHQFLNLHLTELPRGDWAFTILRQYFFSVYQRNLFAHLNKQATQPLTAITEKAIKETEYHVKWCSEWVIRLGDGTQESHQRIKLALDDLWNYTAEFFELSAYENEILINEWNIPVATIKDSWIQYIDRIFKEATLTLPSVTEYKNASGKDGRHTEHMGYILAEMQCLHRMHPNAAW